MTTTASKFLLVPLCLTVAAASAIHETAGRSSMGTSTVELDVAGESATTSSMEQSPSFEKSSSSIPKQQQDDDDDDDCGIWLAPSTIQGAGLGMFAGRAFQERDVLLPTGDSVIGIVDIQLHNLNNKHNSEAFLWDEYTWSGKALRLDREGHGEVNVASAGFGAAVNCFLPIVNADEYNPVLQWEGLQRGRDPGAGASTQYHGRLSVAKRPIAAGEEFFVSCEYCSYCTIICCLFDGYSYFVCVYWTMVLTTIALKYYHSSFGRRIRVVQVSSISGTHSALRRPGSRIQCIAKIS